MDDEDFEDAEYRIKDWMPPWIDNGRRLGELVEKLTEMNDEDAWKVAVVLLIHQLDEDVQRLKSLIDQIKEIERQFNDND